MSWFGKILTFVVFIACLLWAYFTVNAYVTRTNWKVRADVYEKAFRESEDARQKEFRDFQSSREALVRMREVEKTRGDDLAKSLEDLAAAGRRADADYKRLETNYTNSDVQAKILQASVTRTLDELTDTRKRNSKLEDDRVQLVLAKEAADRDKLRAENESKLSRAIAEENAKKIESLTALVTELRLSGGGGGQATVLRSIEKVPAPLPENIRGTVVRDMFGDLVQISIGIDAGLEPGSRLDVYRESNGGQYLGTLIVTRAIQPKEAVAEFKPARRVPIAQLRPDELPRKGDTVGNVSIGRIGR
jgi:hypothetical protein